MLYAICYKMQHRSLFSLVRMIATAVLIGHMGTANAQTLQQRIEFLRRVTSVTDDSYCIDFSPFVRGYIPGVISPPESVIAQAMDSLVATRRVRCIFVYGADIPAIPRLARERGIYVIQNAWIDANTAANNIQISQAIALARQYPQTIIGLVCGTEVRLRNFAGVANREVLNCVNQMRAAGVVQPIGHHATWPEWCDEEFPGQRYPNNCRRWEPVASAVDIIYVSAYAWWENQVGIRFPCIGTEQAPGFHVDRLNEIIARYSPKLAILAEFGHPGTPVTYVDPDSRAGPCNIASVPNQRFIGAETLRLLRDQGHQGLLFSAFDEPWKVASEGYIGEFWGFCAPDPPYACTLPPVGINGPAVAIGDPLSDVRGLGFGNSTDTGGGGTGVQPSTAPSLAVLPPPGIIDSGGSESATAVAESGIPESQTPAVGGGGSSTSSQAPSPPVEAASSSASLLPSSSTPAGASPGATASAIAAATLTPAAPSTGTATPGGGIIVTTATAVPAGTLTPVAAASTSPLTEASGTAAAQPSTSSGGAAAQTATPVRAASPSGSTLSKTPAARSQSSFPTFDTGGGEISNGGGGTGASAGISDAWWWTTITVILTGTITIIMGHGADTAAESTTTGRRVLQLAQ